LMLLDFEAELDAESVVLVDLRAPLSLEADVRYSPTGP